MAKNRIKVKLEMNGEKERVKANGIILMTNEDRGIRCMCGGMIDPDHIAAALIHQAIVREGRDEGNDLIRDIVTKIMLRGCQEEELVDNASFMVETAKMIREVLGQDGDEE